MAAVDHLVLCSGGLDVGGVERYVLQLAESATDAPRVTVLSPVSDRFREAAEAIPRVQVVAPPPPSRTDRLVPGALVDVLRELGPSVLHTQDTNARLRSHLAARRLGVPTVHTVHMSPLYYPGISAARRAAYRWAERATSGRTDAFVFVSHMEREVYLEAGVVPPERAVTVHNGIPPATARPVDRDGVRERLGCAPDATLATFVGRLAAQKGLDYLIEAAGRLDGTDLQVLIVGDGEDAEALRAQAAALPPGRVVFGGYQPAGAVYDVLRASDLFVLPSRFECFPFATLEALQAGLPCVVTDVGGNREAITSGENGLVIPPHRPDLLADALTELAEDPDRRAALGNAARATARTFSVDRMVGETEAVYARVLSGRPAAA